MICIKNIYFCNNSHKISLKKEISSVQIISKINNKTESVTLHKSHDFIEFIGQIHEENDNRNDQPVPCLEHDTITKIRKVILRDPKEVQNRHSKDLRNVKRDPENRHKNRVRHGL